MTLSLDELPSPALIIDAFGIIVQTNLSIELLTGYTQEEILQQPVELLVPEYLKDQHFKYRTNYQNMVEELSTCSHVAMQKKSGTFVQVNVKISALKKHCLIIINEHNNVINNYNNDKLADIHQVIEGINEPYWEWDIIEDTFLYSAQLMFFLGYKKNTFIGSRDFWIKHLSAYTLKEIYLKTESYLYQSGASLDITAELTTEQGKHRWINLIGKVIEFKNNKPCRMIGTVKDISEFKQLISSLKKQNEYLTLAQKISMSGHWRYNFKDNSFYWSSEIYRIYGLDNSTFQPNLDNVLTFQSEQEQLSFRRLINQAKEKKQGFYNKGTLLKKSGKKVKIETTAEVEIDKNGEVIGLFGICRDITKAENMLEKIKLLAMVNFTINVPIFFVDEQDNIVYQDISLTQTEDNSGLFNYVNFSITQYLEFKKKAGKKGQFKKNNVSFDKFNTVFNISVTHAQGEGIYIWIVENVTEQFRKDQQQIISNRLALLGNTFGNVSHDINNVLGVALGAIEMLEIKFTKGEQNIGTYIERVKNAIDKGKSVTERLLAFTRKPVIKVVTFDPIADLEKNKYLFEQLLLSTINISFDYQVQQCSIKFPQGEFINILLNLVLNAQDAIQENGLSGQIQISTKINKEQRLEIHVKDSGIGIDEDNLSKIFDPFYSSKSVNKGNGIGLANVFNTMYKYNGKIKVEGQCDLGGAHFILIFKCDVLKTALPKSYIPKASLGLKDKKILVLDDEISIAEFVSLYLDNHGAITTCLHDKSGLLKQLEKDDKFDIFITDMIMPDLSGKEAVDLVKNKFPNIVIYSMSGYIAIKDRKWEYPVLRKPFNSNELSHFLEKQYQ